MIPNKSQKFIWTPKQKLKRKSGVCGFRVKNLYHQGNGEEGDGKIININHEEVINGNRAKH
jgi:hypothetical protein